ncbi:MAG TPA: DUF373 family protein [Candidatus Bathyarchaeota archaeon]|nr:DUF373 family protein [Candidatus Bathyarchaeota archaeon]
MGERKAERTLVLCVDRDDDVGVKAKVKTPIIGKEENLRVATKLALADPEEADANAMFEAVRLYEHLTATAGPGEAYEIATITGSPLGGVKADRKLLAELSEVLRVFPANGVILVTDGYADEVVIPLIQSKVPIVSVKRVVVRHSRSIEETAALFSRYLRLLLENPRYSRIVLGLPGALILILVVLWMLNLLVYAWMAILVGIGAFMFVKGFGLDRRIENFIRAARSRVFKFPPPHVYVAAISYAAGTLIVLLATYQVAWYLTYYAPVVGISYADLAALIGWLCVNTSHMFVAGFCVLILGRCLHWFMRKDPRGWYGLVGLLVCAWSYRLLYEAGRILLNPMLSYTDLMATFLVGVLMVALATIIVNIIRARLAWPGRGGLEAEEGS